MCFVGAAASVGPVNSGCCEDDEGVTEQEESKGVPGPVSLSAIMCSPMTVLYFPIPRELLSLDNHNLAHTEKDAVGNSGPASDPGSPTRDRTQALGSESEQSQPLDHQGIPEKYFSNWWSLTGHLKTKAPLKKRSFLQR